MYSIQHLWNSKSTFYLRIKRCSDLTPPPTSPHLFPKGFFFPAHESLPGRSKDKSQLIGCQWVRSPPCLIMNTLSSSEKTGHFSAYKALSGTCYTPGSSAGPSQLPLASDSWSLSDSTLGCFLPRVIFNLELSMQPTLFSRHSAEPGDTKVNLYL